jgi:hypothetical protein
MDDLQELLKERMSQLPPVVQRAITSADVEKNLRKLADTHKLHLDQWQILENNVMLTLLGLQQSDLLEKNIQSEVGVAADVARELAENINTIVFEPIRQELERQLEHPEAQEKQFTGIEAARNQELAKAEGQGVTQAPSAPAEAAPAAVQPATPPPPAPEVKVARPDDGSNYKPGETSAQRAAVHDDPYREPPA